MKARIFISYSAKDASFTEQLYGEIDKDRYEVWRDKNRLEIDWSQEIALELARSDVLCLIWTQSASGSNWVRHEWLTARALGKVIIPIIFDNSPDLPKPIFNLHAIKSRDVGQTRDRLIERLESLKSYAHGYDYSAVSPDVHIPFNPNPDFINRKEELAGLYLKMIGDLNKIGISQVGILGMSGVGKTQLAAEFVHRFGFAFDGIYWIQAENSEKWLRQFVHLAKGKLRLKIPDPNSPEAERDYLLELQKYCRARPQMLIIMDNVVEPKLLHSNRIFFSDTDLMPLTLGFNLLFSTLRKFNLPGVGIQEVGVLSPSAAYELLTSSLRPESPEEGRKAGAICEAVGFHPLALVLIAGYLQRYRQVSFGQYYAMLETNRLGTIDLSEMSEESLATRHKAAVKFTLNNQWEMLEDLPARELFKLSGLFPSAMAIPKARLSLYSGIGRSASRPGSPLDRSFRLLDELNLIEELDNGKSIRLHPLVQEFVSGLVSTQDQERDLRNKAISNLVRCFSDPSRLELEVSERGIDAVIEDVQIGISWRGEETAGLAELEVLLRVLDQERHHFSDDSKVTIGPRPHLLQQLQYRSSILGFRRLADKLHQAGREKSLPTFKFLFSNEMEEMARICSVRGHKASIEEVSLSEDGRRGMSLSSDNMIVLWDFEIGRAISSFGAEKLGTAVIALGPDGRHVLYVSREMEMVLEDLQSGEIKQTLKAPSGKIRRVFMSADGRRAVGVCKHEDSGYRPDSAVLWDLDNGETLGTIPELKTSIHSISADGRLALGNDDPPSLWDFKSCDIIRIFEKMSDRSNDPDLMALSPDGRFAIGGYEYGRLRLWDCQSGERIHTFKGHEEKITSLAFSRDGRLVISGSNDRTSIVWDVESRRRLGVFRGHTGTVKAVCFSADGRRALSGSDDGRLILWDVAAGRHSRVGKGHKDEITGVDLSGSGERALSGSQENKLILWDVKKRKQLRVFTANFFPSDWKLLNGVGLSADGRRALSCSCGGDGKSDLIVWDLEKENTALAWFSLDYYPWADRNAPVRIGIPQPMRATSVAFDEAGRIIMSGCNNGMIILDDCEGEKKRICEFPGHKGIVGAVALDSSRGLGLSGGDDNKMILWNLKERRKIREFAGHSAPITAVCLFPDRNSALSGSKDQTLILWDLNDGTKRRTFSGHSAPVTGASFFHDGRLAISCSRDMSVILWDISSSEILARLWVRHPLLSLSAKKNIVILGSTAGVVELFEISL